METIDEKIDLFSEVLADKINKEYVEDVGQSRGYGSYMKRRFAKSLDPYSAYMSARNIRRSASRN